MLDIFYIEGVYCTGGQCDTYTGEVSLDEIMLGDFSLTSDSGKKAAVNLNIMTCDINIAVDGQKRELKGLEFVTNNDGSWYINKDIGSDKFEITITPS